MYIDYLSDMPLIDALWWFIENRGTMNSSDENEIFFYLRDRYFEK